MSAAQPAATDHVPAAAEIQLAVPNLLHAVVLLTNLPDARHERLPAPPEKSAAALNLNTPGAQLYPNTVELLSGTIKINNVVEIGTAMSSDTIPITGIASLCIQHRWIIVYCDVSTGTCSRVRYWGLCSRRSPVGDTS